MDQKSVYHNVLFLSFPVNMQAFRILGLFSVLKEKSFFQETETVFPHVRCSGNIFEATTPLEIFVDRTSVTQCSNILTAITTIFGIYWLFDISYSKDQNNFLVFLDQLVFKKKSCKPSMRLKSLMNKLWTRSLFDPLQFE